MILDMLGTEELVFYRAGGIEVDIFQGLAGGFTKKLVTTSWGIHKTGALIINF